MLHLEVLRHGLTERSGYYGSTEVPLTERGRGQMWQAVQGRRWDRIVTSPLRRCSDFAEALAARLRLPCETDARLREMHFGRWEGRDAEQLLADEPEALGRFWADPLAHPPPDAEPLPALRLRLFEMVSELAVQSSGQRVLLVTHGGPIRILLSAADERPLAQLLHVDVAHAALFGLRVRRAADGSLLIRRAAA